MKDDRGSATVEVVLLAPVLALVLMFVTASGRMVEASVAVRGAAESGARAASQVSAARMTDVGTSVAMSHISGLAVCRRPRVSVVHDTRNGPARVIVTASCAVNRTGIISLVPAPQFITRSSTEVVDVFTFR